MSLSQPLTPPAIDCPDEETHHRPAGRRLLISGGCLAITALAAYAAIASRNEWGAPPFAQLRSVLTDIATFRQRSPAPAAATPVRTESPWFGLSPAPTAPSGNEVMSGDHLRIAFYERSGVPLPADGPEPPRLVTVTFPRMDLTGDYTIADTGVLNVPTLGQVAADGKPAAALEAELAARLTHRMGRQTDVRITILDRLPIYVVGQVRVPGTLKYFPGMTVLQAIAGAGGNAGDAADLSRKIEYLRQEGQTRHARDTLDRLLVRQALLLAERSDATTITPPPLLTARLSESLGGDEVRQMLAGAEESLRIERKRALQQRERAARRIAMLKLELDAENLRSAHLAELLAQKREKLRAMEAINGNRSISSFRLTEMRGEIADHQGRQADVQVSLAGVRRRLAEAEIELDQAVADRANRIDTELTDISQQIGTVTRDIATADAILQTFQAMSPDKDADSAAKPITIARRTADRLIVLEATADMRLRPGDVVQVNASIEGAQHRIRMVNEDPIHVN